MTFTHGALTNARICLTSNFWAGAAWEPQPLIAIHIKNMETSFPATIYMEPADVKSSHTLNTRGNGCNTNSLTQCISELYMKTWIAIQKSIFAIIRGWTSGSGNLR